MSDIINICNSKYYYKKEKLIGKGSFCSVYKGYRKMSDNKMINVAVKIEKKNGEINTLLKEYKYYKLLREKNKDSNNIPKYYALLKDENNYYLILQLYGLSLESIKKKINKEFDLFSIKNIAINIIKLIEFIHECGFLHRDIKPDNILLSKDYKKIYLIDFGLSKDYIVKKAHISNRTGVNPSGTLRYMSKNVNLGNECSRRDDLISLGYTIIYLIKGKLPWQGIKISKNNKKYEILGDIKNKVKIQDLCKDLPKCILKYISYCYKLRFEENPDYKYLISLFS